MASATRRWRLTVEGRVQGIGFRPWIHRLATTLGLAGQVENRAGGVVIEAEGRVAALEALRAVLRGGPAPHDASGCPLTAPAPAVIRHVQVAEATPVGATTFRIGEESAAAGGAMAPGVGPDQAICPDCRAEIADSGARRYRYPFTTCAVCGPRWSLARALPWGRARTTLADFPLCDACAEEYRDPADRRFHAETLACPACGPRLQWRGGDGTPGERDEAALTAALAVLRDGGIVALKGLGGFQLLVDAANPDAVAELRRRKARPEKPLAVMFPDCVAVETVCHVDPLAAETLASAAAPIVLLPRRTDAAAQTVAAGVAPGLDELGAFLPTTALHHLLLSDSGGPLVVTSGNRAGEPLCAEGSEAVERLAGIADGFLDHDRPIAQPMDDSVVRVIGGRPQVLRLARGLAPWVVAPAPRADEPAADPEEALPPAEESTAVVALGGQLKAAPAVAVADHWILGPHVGDLDGPLAEARLWRTATGLVERSGAGVGAVVHDTHPDYASTRMAEAGAWPRHAVPHHQAHALAVLVDRGLLRPGMTHWPEATVLAWDGTGHGEGGALLGSEVLRVDADGITPLARLRPFPLPGGEQAIREPRRAALGLLHAYHGGEGEALAADPLAEHFDTATWSLLCQSLDRRLQCPESSGMGRLFDAVAALLGLCAGPVYEGRAALLLEQCAARAAAAEPGYPLHVAPRAEGPAIIEWAPMLAALLADRAAGVAPAIIARRFHNGLVALTPRLAAPGGAEPVLFSGGCWHNRLLVEGAATALEGAGYRAGWSEIIPSGDGGLAMGQLAHYAMPSMDRAHP